jgi:hypothetical protein
MFVASMLIYTVDFAASNGLSRSTISLPRCSRDQFPTLISYPLLTCVLTHH